MHKATDTHDSFSSSTELQIARTERSALYLPWFWLVSIYLLISGKHYHLWIGGLSVGFLATALVMPRLLRPLNRLWFKIGLLLHKLSAPVMGLVFFSTVVPTGLLMRLFGKGLWL